jgi:riboflavin biosynthesis pyrimidine reductase
MIVLTRRRPALEDPVHLLLRDGVPLSSPVPVRTDAAGALELAALYAVPALPGGRPHVRAMMNASVDGAIIGTDGTSGPLRNPDDSFVFDVLRALTDVVLVGAATVRAEDYRRPLGRRDLLVPSRRPGGAPRPALAIWSNSGDLPESIEPDWPTYLVAAPESAPEAGRRAGLPEENVLPADGPLEAIDALAARGMRGIQAEGGPAALGRLAAAGMLDELCISTSHRTVGGISPRLMEGVPHDQSWELSSLLVGEHATLARYLRAH